MKGTTKRINWLVITVLVIGIIAISAPMYYFRIMGGTENDYGGHIVDTYTLLEKKPLTPLTLGHPLLQLILAGMVWISRWHIDPFAAMIILMVVCQVVLALTLYFWLGELKCKGGDWIRALVACSITIITPILALAPVDNKFYFGYIGLADYHSPTMLLLRPLALISFIFAFQIFDKPRNPGWMMAVSSITVILTALAKPNYLMCILPAILVLGIIWYIRKLRWDWRLFLFGFVIPGVSILFLQWMLVFGTSAVSSIMIDPFVISYSSSYLFWKFLLSILFPAAMTGLFFRKIIKDSYVLLGWIGFIGGAVMLYFLSESGARMYDGNLSWGAEVMLFLLIASMVRFCLKTFAVEKTVLWKRLLIWGIYLLYVASGIVYYVHCITGSSYG